MSTDHQPALRGLYAITDPQLTPTDQLFAACAAALRGGARLLQYRDKQADYDARLARARALRTLCDQYEARLIINDDPALALACGADGVHLGQQDAALADARARLGPDALIGISCHGDLTLARRAADQGADYVALGRFYPSHTKPHAPATELAVLKEARQQLMLPLVAIGGITPDNAPPLLAAGADMLAVIHGLFASTDIERTAARFASLFPE